MWAVRYLLVLGGAFFAGWSMYAYVHPLPTYAFQPDDCKYAGKHATGWEVRSTYQGGLARGGITAATEYECK